MLPDEFREWLSDYLAAFPGTEEWLGRLPNRQATVAHWRGTLADVDPAAAKEATRLMLAGELEAPKAYEREHTASRIRQIARQIAWQRSGCDHTDPPKKVAQRRRGGLSAASVLAKGFAERTDEVAGTLPESVYGCDLCHDVGTVTIWHPVSVAEAAGTRKRPRRVATAAVACQCHRGNRLASGVEPKPGRPAYRGLPVYDERRHCVVESGLPDAADVDRLLGWLSNREPVQRHAEFDEWNQGDVPF